MNLPVARISVTPDAVTGPRPWPEPYSDEDDACEDCDGCAWCDQSWWRSHYAQLHASHRALMDEVRDAASHLDTLGPEARSVAKHLRTRLGTAAVNMNLRPKPN